jgi:hypothetical protein
MAKFAQTAKKRPKLSAKMRCNRFHYTAMTSLISIERLLKKAGYSTREKKKASARLAL